ncbi:biosynthetic-type acetolactate synthase large subunit [Oscillibacter sp. MSJ-2]|uniref:Acetolactate synthase n=1 Tax=Dysosmobacter acutus TaxID=2841504 RepID=A0ABS6F5Q5_9FIRM|nr:biosynthetic-type acetolactate synthase large subunit [Dysosmobacter acutus]MBU5625624.1 biosynthetic-type acetolactate synthase large subunit [Dysosmobacter acutus]
MVLTGAEIIVEVLIEQGVTNLFGYPGGAALNIYDALYQRRDRITHYLTAHEQGASHAADGYARATGKTGVCLATSGPGATNLVTGIATAYLDSIPMVAITANVGTELIGKDSFQEVFITGITTPITKHNYAVRDITRLAHTLRTAFRIASSGRKGPVLVDIPKDITAATCEYTPEPPAAPEAPMQPDMQQLRQAAALLARSHRPVLCFGGGVISANASRELVEFVRKAHIPACHTIMGTGVIGFGDELDLGMIGMHGSMVANTAIDQADLLLAVGTRFSDRVALKTDAFAPKAQVVHFDIDPSEFDKNVPSSLAVAGDLKAALTALLPLVEPRDRSGWQEKIEFWRQKDYYPASEPGVLHPHTIMEIIGQEAGEDAVVVTDVGQHQIWAAQYCKKTKPRGFITSGGLGTMGFGYGAAIGAKVALGGSAKVIHVTGDGSFHMNMNEACTAVSNNLQVITVLMDNKVLGMVRQWQTSFYDGHYMCTEPERKSDYVKIAEGFGARGFRAETPEQFRAVLDEALRLDGPSWIVCPIDREERVLPMIPSGMTVQDIILE